MPKMVSLRLDEELLEWADGYAKKRGVPRTEIVAEALRSLREDSVRTVPGLPQGPVRAVIRPGTPSARASSQRGVISGAVVQRASSMARDPDVLARQAKLNKAKYG